MVAQEQVVLPRIHYRATAPNGGVAKSSNGSFPVDQDLYEAWQAFRRDKQHHPTREEVAAFMAGFNSQGEDSPTRQRENRGIYGKGKHDGREEMYREIWAIIKPYTHSEFPPTVDGITEVIRGIIDDATAPQSGTEQVAESLDQVPVRDLLNALIRRDVAAERQFEQLTARNSDLERAVKQSQADAARFARIREALAEV